MTISAAKKLNNDDFAETSSDILVSENKFRESLKQLEAQAREICEEKPGTPICREAELRAELQQAEHDNAGAYKSKRFYRETVGLFESEQINIDEKTGEYRLPPELEGRRYLFISMSELDRLNKEGHSQEAGDAGLRAVVKAIDEVCVKYLGPKRTKAMNIFRYGGNEYCIEFNDIKADDLAVIENEIMNAQLDLGGDYKDIEAPPISTYKIDLAAAMEILNDVGAELDQYAAGHKTINIIRREADFNLEVKKFITRVDRAIEKLATAKTRGDARDFFNNYLKKGFHGSGLETIDDIEALIKDKDPEGLRHTIEWMANDAAKDKFAEERKLDAHEDHLVDVRHHEILQAAEPRTDAEHMEREFDTSRKIAVIPQMTGGQAVLVRKRLEMMSAKNTEWAEAKRLEYMIEAAKRDEGTGLLERGQFYEDWIEQVNATEATGDKAAVIFVDMGFLKYFNDAGGRKVGDAALCKAAELMEEAVRVSGAKGIVYRYGGDEFAIRIEGGRIEAEKVTSALEQLRSEAGRIPDLKGLHKQRNALGEVGSSRSDYEPTELVFNAGIADGEDFVVILNDLRESGELEKMLLARGMDENEFKASLMVKLADTSVNYEKALSRFHLLIELMNKPEYKDAGSPYHARVESIVKYSQKAILGGLGGDAALRIFADNMQHEEWPVLKIQIERFVADRIEKTKEIANGEKNLIDKLVEIHAARGRLIEEIDGLKAELLGKTGALAHEHERVIELQAKLNEAENARQALIEARQNIAVNTLDKKSQIG